MAVEDAKKQDYLAVGNYAAQIRQDATYHFDIVSTSAGSLNRFLTTAATRLAGIRVVTDVVIASGSVAFTIFRVRAGALTTLASFVMDGSIVTAVDTVFELTPAQMSLVTSKGVKAGDAIRLFAAPTTPTAASISVALQFAQNGPR